MGKRREKLDSRSSQTLPPSPSHSSASSASSDFEFTISLSPRKSSPANICPADELFYKGQLLPLHLSPRISMVRTLLLASSSTSSSSDATTTASRDSSSSTSSTSSSAASSADLLLLAAGDPFCDSSRPSSVAPDDLPDDLKRLTGGKKTSAGNGKYYFSLSRFSSVFKKDNSNSKSRDSSAAVDNNAAAGGASSVRRMSTTAKDVIRKYLKKVKPLYEKLSQKQQQQQKMGLFPNGVASFPHPRSGKGNSNNGVVSDCGEEKVINRTSSSGTANTAPVRGFSHSFSGNLKYPRKRSSNIIASSCPSSMRSSPSHSGVLSRSGFAGGSGTNNNNNNSNNNSRPGSYGDASSMEELQSAIQGAIAHCKNSMMMPPPQRQGKGIFISNEI